MSELKNITTTSDNNVILKGMFQLRSVLVFLDVVVTFLGSITVLTSNGSFWIGPLLPSVSYMFS